MAKPTDEQRAVALIFEYLHQEGLDWFRNADIEGLEYYKKIRAGYDFVDEEQVGQIRAKPASQFPKRHVSVMVPPAKHKHPLLALWVRWNFKAAAAECGYYIGFWSEFDGAHSFVGFRFESPEEGEQHDYFHCQPCRNLGDRERDDEMAVPISQRTPTFPLPARNSAELALAMVLALRGRSGFEEFRRKMLVRVVEARNSSVLQAGLKKIGELVESRLAPAGAV